jgi:hypothetical protein
MLRLNIHLPQVRVAVPADAEAVLYGRPCDCRGLSERRVAQGFASRFCRDRLTDLLAARLLRSVHGARAQARGTAAASRLARARENAA